MNTTCQPETCATKTSAKPSAGVTENPQKPHYTVNNRAEAFEILVDLPGVSKNAINIQLEDDILIIRGARQTVTPETWKPLHREIHDQPYLLRLRVNTPVNEEQLSAALEDGVLKVTLPLKSPTQARRIEIQ